jgi:hypothetical protein
MKKLYIEGVATHDDPESCAGARKGAGEALTGAHVGQAKEPRKHQVLGADVVARGGRLHDTEQKRSLRVDLARSKNLSMRRVSRRENREIPEPPDEDVASGRGGKAKAVIRR